uniref:T9SS C-terminal target domain-containing protein n=1 Tax=Prevotella sp. GTC17253 TaxID=3236793 RepID=A0AB33IRB6_9BACT
MMKRLLSLLAVGMLAMTTPQILHASSVEYSVNDEFSKISISIINRNVLAITGANGQVVRVYNLTGMCVVSYKIDADNFHYDLNLPKGCYIVKVGTVVRKVSVS